jgi:hypothetical protein
VSCVVGQEIYYTTHEFFLSERSLYLVIFDLSKGLNAAYMEHWLQSIVSRAPDAPVMVVGTHLDQCADDQVSHPPVVSARPYVLCCAVLCCRD